VSLLTDMWQGRFQVRPPNNRLARACYPTRKHLFSGQAAVPPMPLWGWRQLPRWL